MKFYLLLVLSFTFIVSSVSAQDGNATIPSATVKSIDGKSFDTADFNNDGKPMIINFWATWCAPCKKELNNIAEVYDDWQDETGVKLVAISIDDARSQSSVFPYVNGSLGIMKYISIENQDFKRAMGVNNVPHTSF